MQTTRDGIGLDQLIRLVENLIEKMKAKTITGMKARSKPVSSIIGDIDRFLLGTEFSN